MTWTIEGRAYGSWTTESISSVERITEAGVVRITEQGDTRIIEHFDTHWSNQASTVNPWTKE